MARVLLMPGVEKLAGFVLPKSTRHNFSSYFEQVRHTHHLLMPTLETVEVFDDEEMKLFRRTLAAPEVRARILALRIGGNDLLALLGLRRPTSGTIYQTPLGQVIGRLVTIFKPHGFELTAPVFEHLTQDDWLAAEVAQDMAHGMIAKTAIHPDQVPQIERHYQVAQSDIELALRIIDPGQPGRVPHAGIDVRSGHPQQLGAAHHRAGAPVRHPPCRRRRPAPPFESTHQ